MLYNHLKTEKNLLQIMGYLRVYDNHVTTEIFFTNYMVSLLLR